MARDDAPHENAGDPPRYRQSSFVTGDCTAGSDGPITRGDWERLPADPDPERDLGYRIEHWDTFRANDDGENVMFLPSDESLLKTDAFVVADENSVCDVNERL